jgi:predicted transcriptional regulator
MLVQQRFVTHERAESVPSVTTKGLPIGRTLKVERVAAGVSLTDMARALGVSIGHLSHIEAGRRTASPELVVQYRAALQEWAA